MKKYNEDDFVVHCNTIEEHRLITSMYPNGCNTEWTDADFKIRQHIRIRNGELFSHGHSESYKNLDILEANKIINKQIHYEIY